MKLLALIFGVAAMLTFGSCNQNQQEQAPITLEELSRRNVVGELGLLLGTPAEIEAEVVSGDSLRMKEFASVYLLKVTHVDGKALSSPPLMRFYSPPFAPVDLASSQFELFEQKHGEKAVAADLSQIAEAERGYVGKRMQLVVYEVGSFHGAPEQLPNDVPIWADSSFHFSTVLTVLKERMPTK